ncbi:hypothetical protein G0D86_29730 (plasmid) [Burkholderia multivorans]|uniref:hypothetical protein n=1 Tax=Burkholderia multivorans TaxID=87883 RepID=UPI0019D1D09F|nr:hypothetical protein [Burkholderia multivorans]QSL63970.1 hypothetical protein G0D86_29730 [Burkholderia multivorans]
MSSKTTWNTERKLPFWLRRVDVAVQGQAAAEQRIEFNWRLVSVPLNSIVAGLFGIAVGAFVAALFCFAVSLVKTFPVLAASVMIFLLFTVACGLGIQLNRKKWP